MFPLADFVDDVRAELDSINNIRQLNAALKKIATDSHVSHIIYHLPEIPNSISSDSITLLTYPESWIERYLHQSYRRIDPVVSLSAHTILPTDWSTLARNSKRVRTMFGEAKEHGVGPHGITIPLRGRLGESALFSFTSHEDDYVWRDIRRFALPSLHVTAYFVHHKVLELTSGPKSIRSARLSPRELDCLRFLAIGMRDTEIADTLGISRRVVSAYVESMRIKLGSPTRANAVMKGLKMKLISPDFN